MHNKEEIFSQALKDANAIHEQKPLGYSVINYGVKIQKFSSKIEILNCSKSGDYFQECSKDEYEMFFIHGWKKGGLRLSMMNCKRKLDLIEERIKREVNTRKNDKHIQRLKTSRENLLIKYSKRNKQLNKLTNGKEKEHL